MPKGQAPHNFGSKKFAEDERLRIKEMAARHMMETGQAPPEIDPNTIWSPQRGSQYAFHACPAFEALYGGAAGGGKSDSLLVEALRFAGQPGYKGIIFRRTYPELEKSLVPRAYEIYTGKGKASNKGTQWTFPNGSIIYLSHLQHEEDKEKHKSAEYDYIGFDELTSFLESQYIYLFSRCRGKNKEIQRRIRAATNPTGVGHGWVKKRFLDINLEEVEETGFVDYEYASGWKVGNRIFTSFSDLPDGYEKGDPYFTPAEYSVWKDKKSGLTRSFIPALIWGNTRLVKADPGYIKRLQALPEKQQKALLYGHWDVFEGQFFSSWDQEKNVCVPFEIPKSWKKFVAIDYGYTAPFAALWFAIDENGTCYCYRELYASKWTPEEQARQILEASGDENIEWFAADPSMWRSTGTGESFAQIYDRHGLSLLPSNNNRPAGWAIMHDMIAAGKLVFFETCKNAIRTIPTLNHSRRNPEDLDTLQEDHAADAARYFLLTLRGFKTQERVSHGKAIPDWWKEVERNRRQTRFVVRSHL